MAESDLFYVSSEGDVLDAIIVSHYGDALDGKVQAVLAANPGLARLGAVFGAGVRIRLPEIESISSVSTEQLWG